MSLLMWLGGGFGVDFVRRRDEVGVGEGEGSAARGVDVDGEVDRSRPTDGGANREVDGVAGTRADL